MRLCFLSALLTTPSSPPERWRVLWQLALADDEILPFSPTQTAPRITEKADVTIPLAAAHETPAIVPEYTVTAHNSHPWEPPLTGQTQLSVLPQPNFISSPTSSYSPFVRRRAEKTPKQNPRTMASPFFYHALSSAAVNSERTGELGCLRHTLIRSHAPMYLVRWHVVLGRSVAFSG